MSTPQKLIEEAVELYGNKFLFVYPNKSLPNEYDWIFGTSTEKGYTGICSHCGNHMEYSGNFKQQRCYGAVTNDEVICSGCGNRLIVKKGWYSKAGLKHKFYLQAIDVPEFNKVVIYETIVCLEDWDDYRNEYGASVKYQYDLRHTVLTPGESKTTRWTGQTLKNAYLCTEREACGGQITPYGYPITTEGHITGIEKLFDSFLAPVARKLELDENTHAFSGTLAYLIRFNEQPMTELLYSLGYTNMAANKVFASEFNKSRYMKFNTKSPKNFFRGMNNEKKAVVNEWFMNLTNKDDWTVRQTEKIIKFIKNHEGIKAAMLDFRNIKAERNATETFLRAVDLLSAFSPEKISNYIKKTYDPAKPFLYTDYLELALRLNPELTDSLVAFPKNLVKAHDEYAKRVKFMADREKDRLVRDRKHKELLPLSYKWKGLFAYIPETYGEIAKEGEKMGNCIGSYAGKHSQGTTTVIFIRRENSPETPFFDLELALEFKDFERMIRQCYGKKNSVNAKHPEYNKQHKPEAEYVNAFLKKFVKHINWCKKNKKLAKKYYGKEKSA